MYIGEIMSIKYGQFLEKNISFQFLESDEIRICVCPEKGGELSSVKYKNLMDNRELLFRGNDYSPTDLPYPGRAPLMWPAVTRNYIKEVEPTVKEGSLPENSSYRYKNKVYYVPGRSGFAKDMSWQLIHNTSDKGIRIGLNSSDRTLEMYPFDFSLTADFYIHDDNVFVEYTIVNLSKDKMFFSFGNHIGLNIPFCKGSNKKDMILQSSGKYKMTYNNNLMFTGERIPIPLSEGMKFGNYPYIYTVTTSGYNYNNNYFRIIDNCLTYEITQRIDRQRSREYILPPEEEIYFTTWGGEDIGFICSEPWIGGVNSFNTKKGLIYLNPDGLFIWQLKINMKKS
jgi:galactose mutarotase-like enzyme